MANKLSIDIELNSKQYTEGARQAAKATEDVKKATEDYLKDFGPLRKQLAAAKREAQDLAGKFAMLGEAERESELGKDMAEELDFAIKKAAELKKVMKNVNDAINRNSSDISGIEGLKEAFDIGKSAATAYIGVIGRLSGSEKDLQKVVSTLTAVQGTFNTVIKVSTALQKESKLMTALQQSGVISYTQAVKINTAAEKASIVVTKALGTAMKALPYVAVAAGVLAVGKAMVNWLTNAQKIEDQQVKEKRALTELEQRLKSISDTYVNSFTRSLGSTISKFEQLKRSYNSLTSDKDKLEWWKQNGEACKKLEVGINSVKDADNAFKGESEKVITILRLRALMTAEAARNAELYAEKMKEIDAAQKNAVKFQEGQKISGSDIDRYGLEKGKDYTQNEKNIGDYTLTAQGAIKASEAAISKSISHRTSTIEEELQQSNNRIDELNKELINTVGNIGSGEGNKEQITELQKLIKVADDYNTKIENIKDPSSEKGKQELEKLKVLWANAALEAEKYKHAIGLPVDTKNIEKIVDILNYTTKEAKDLKISLGVEIPKSKLQELKDKLKEAQTNLEFAISEEDVQKARAKINNLKEDIEAEEVRLGIKVEPVSDGKDVKKVQNILQETFNKITPPKYEFSFISDDFKYEGQSIVDIENKYAALTEARKQLTEVMNTSTDDQAIHDAQIGLQAIGDELDSLEPKLETLNKINEKFKQFQEISNAAGKAGNYLNQLGSAFTQLGEATDSAGVKAVGIILETLANLALSFSQAMIQAAAMGPWAWIAFGIAGVAQLAAMISQIKGMVSGGFAEGGVVPGSSFSGDKLLIRANSGERILTAKQNENLEKIANGMVAPMQKDDLGSVQFIIKGTSLVGTINNTLKTNRKQPIG